MYLIVRITKIYAEFCGIYIYCLPTVALSFVKTKSFSVIITIIAINELS